MKNAQIFDPSETPINTKRVLILGSGFGGFYTLIQLISSARPSDNLEITLISDENYFLFSPLLHTVAAGGIETRHITLPIRRLRYRHKFGFVQANIEKIDMKSGTVTTNMGIFGYDYLVIALGGITNMTQMNHIVAEERNVFTLKTLYDSMLIRNHIIELFEVASVEKNLDSQKRLMTFIICGGGYTGIQLATELRDFINKHLLRLYNSIDPHNVRIIVVEQSSKMISDLHPKLASYAHTVVEQMGIDVRLNSKITRIWKDRVEINESETIMNDTLIWVTGIAANSKVSELDVAKDSLGRILINNNLEVCDLPNVYALGDCVHFEDPHSGSVIPPRAHNAVRQAKVAAFNILAQIRGYNKKPYLYSNSGEVVFLGSTQAAFRFLSLRIYGYLAHFLGLLGYALLIPGPYNRVRIIFDWLLYSIFGRDTTLLRQVSATIPKNKGNLP